MSISFVTSAAGNSTAAGGVQIVLTLSGCQAGDLIVAMGGSKGNADPGANAGWAYNAASVYYTNVVDQYNTNGILTGIRFKVGWKVWADANDNTVYFVLGSSSADAAAVFVFWGVDNGTPMDVTAQYATGNSTNPNPPSITPTNNNCAIVACASSTVSDSTPGSITNYTEPTPFMSNVSVPVVGADTTAGAYRLLSGGAGAAQDPAAFSSWSSGRWIAATVAVRPFVAAARSFGMIIG